MRIVIFGAGDKGRKLFCENRNSDFPDEIIAFWDNDCKKWGGYYENIKIDSPQTYSNYCFDYVVIASSYEKEIIVQLRQLGIGEKILTLVEYSRKKCAHSAYLMRYEHKSSLQPSVFDNKVIVYTAITGSYDELNEPLFEAPNIEYVCFTDNKCMDSKKWKIEYISSKSLNSMYLAKRVKLFPNEFLPSDVTSIWVDGKFQVVGNLLEYAQKYGKNEPILCFPHFARKCIYVEASKCIVDGIGRKEEIVRQMSHYVKAGYPFDNGLYEMGCIVRNHSDSMVKKLMAAWWREVITFSNRDQISFPYICWKYRYLPDVSDEDLYRNNWLLCKRAYSKELTIR